MRKLALAVLFTLPLTFSNSANALPINGHALLGATSSADIIEVKGGGRGGGHGWGRGHSSRAFGWSQGRKVGWRGRACPPGQWKKGRC